MYNSKNKHKNIKENKKKYQPTEIAIITYPEQEKLLIERSELILKCREVEIFLLCYLMIVNEKGILYKISPGKCKYMHLYIREIMQRPLNKSNN